MSADAFDFLDVLYLANTFSVAQLRHNIHVAEIRAGVAEMWRDTEYETAEDIFPWVDFAIACREAIECIQHRQPKLQPPHGHIEVEAIKARNDIVVVIEGYTKLRKAGRSFVGCCPIHNERHPSLTVYPDQQRWRCYGCNIGGDAIDFIMAVENVGFKQAVMALGGR